MVKVLTLRKILYKVVKTFQRNSPLFWVTIVLLLGATVFIPRLQANQVITGQNSQSILDAERFEIENKARTTILQAIGGIFVFITAFTALENRRLADDKQISERFAKAVEMLPTEDERLDVRLGKKSLF